ncbi:MAG: NAD(P)-binding domain-containing protein [Sphingomicrobium sp.]
MRIAIIGTGNVGKALAPAFERAGHEVAYGVRDPADPKHVGAVLAVRSARDAANWAEIAVLAVNWAQVEEALGDCGDMVGKVLIDCTNPLTFGPDGISLALGFDTSGGEIIASKTKAKVVKTLNHVGSPVMGSAHRYPTRPIQFVCGGDEQAKQVVSALLCDIGFDPIDYGGIENARKLEPLAMLWIDQAYKHGMALTNALAFTGPNHNA